MDDDPSIHNVRPLPSARTARLGTLHRMSVLPDLADLTAIAGRITAHAAATRDRAGRLDAAVAATGWTGSAAAAFQVEAHLAAATLRNAAGRLDFAADALRRHAARISGPLADIAQAGKDGFHLAEDLALHPDQIVPDAAHLAGDGLHLIGDGIHWMIGI